MPTYEYECIDCGHNFEAFQNITEACLKTCPQCGGQVKRRIGMGAGIIFKGSGFYITDYKNNKSKSGDSKPSETGKNGKETKPINTDKGVSS